MLVPRPWWPSEAWVIPTISASLECGIDCIELERILILREIQERFVTKERCQQVPPGETSDKLLRREGKRSHVR